MKNKFLLIKNSIILMNILVLGMGMPILAAQSPQAENIQINNINDILKIINNIATWMYRIILAAAVIIILMAAFTFLTSGDKPDNIKKAKNQILYAVIGVVISIIAFSVSTIITNILNG